MSLVVTCCHKHYLFDFICIDARDAIVFWSLHGYLVPTKKIVKKDLTGKKSSIKFTIRDSQESFVYFGKSHQEIEDHLMYLKNKKKYIQPFIMCVGEDRFQK